MSDSEIIELKSEIVELIETISKEDDYKKKLKEYERLLKNLSRILILYRFKSDTEKNQYIYEIREFELCQINYFKEYLEVYDKTYTIENRDFSKYLRLNNYIFSFISKERNLVAHNMISKSPDKFYYETYPTKINQMISNLNKAINIVLIQIEGTENIKELSINYEIIGDLCTQKIALLKYYSRNREKDYTQEAIKAEKFYNKALTYRKKNKGAMLSPRVPDYMLIYEDFFFFDEKNREKLLALDFKLKHIQEKLEIWKSSLQEIKFSSEPIKGMKDYFPSDLRSDKWIMNTIEDILELYCYEEYEGPLLEPIEIFAAKSSDELVNEQSFFVEKIKDKKLILRPEITPTLARMIVRKSQELKRPIRWYSFPNCYRYEQPQKGRLREFRQLNVDILGEDNLYAELEIFKISIEILTSFGATAEQFQVYYNSRRFIDAISRYILAIPENKMPFVYKVLDKSDKLDESEFEKYVVDSFQDEFIVQGILKLKDAKNLEDLLKKFDDIPKEFYNSEGYNEITELGKLIKEAGISDYCSFTPNIVRGLDYYTGVVYEVFDTGKENIRAIFGGGRYDDLLSLFSDERVSGIGFGMGVLMLSLFLKTYNLIPEFVGEVDYQDTIYIASVNESVASYVIKLADMIREEDFPCIIDYKFKNVKTQLSKANELGVMVTLIVGPKEMEQNKVTIRNMTTNEQITTEISNLIEEIYKILDELEALDELEDK